MDLRSTQLKDTYGNLVTTGSTAGAPTTGGLQNGQGTLLTSVGIGVSSPAATLDLASGNSGGDAGADAPVFRITNTTQGNDWDIDDAVGTRDIR